MNRKSFEHRAQPATQRGVVLFMSLVFLVILSFVGIYAMRGTILGEQVSRNIRSSEIANLAAETALRHCEDLVVAHDSSIKGKVQPMDHSIPEGELPRKWQTRANWWNATMVHGISYSELTASDARLFRGTGDTTLPLCMVERFEVIPENPRVPDPRIGFLITAVGFSPDYAQNAAHNATAGSEAWLQSALVTIDF